MLTVVYSFACSGMFIGRCAAANEGSALEQADSKPSISQCTCGGEAGNASAYDANGLLFIVDQLWDAALFAIRFSEISI